MSKRSTWKRDHPACAAAAREAVDAVRAEKDREIERLRFRVQHLENEIVANLQGDLAILAESEHLTENALRAEAFSRYEAAVDRWKAMDEPPLIDNRIGPNFGLPKV